RGRRGRTSDAHRKTIFVSRTPWERLRPRRSLAPAGDAERAVEMVEALDEHPIDVRAGARDAASNELRRDLAGTLEVFESQTRAGRSRSLETGEVSRDLLVSLRVFSKRPPLRGVG